MMVSRRFRVSQLRVSSAVCCVAVLAATAAARTLAPRLVRLAGGSAGIGGRAGVGSRAGTGSRTVAVRRVWPRETASPIVTTTADVVADDGQTSLREAINYANNRPGTTITFNIPATDGGFDGHVYTIRPASPLPALQPPGSVDANGAPLNANGTVIDGGTQASATGSTNGVGPVIALDGSGAGDHTNGLEIDAAECTVKNLIIGNFGGVGIHVAGASATGNRIQGCYIGTDATGTAAAGNIIGIHLDQGVQSNVIGLDANTAADGTVTPLQARNIISGNSTQGIFITGDGTANNVVAGNYIGTDVTGEQAVPNGGNGVCMSAYAGAAVGPRGNVVGGTYDGARNVISGNVVAGIQMDGIGTSSNAVLGNYIGTDASGLSRIHNLYGVRVAPGCSDNIIGGAATPALLRAVAGNVISSNDLGGILIYGSSTANNLVQGNFIGTDATRKGQLGNGMNGVKIYQGAHNNVVGGGAADAAPGLNANVIAFNGGDGVQVGDSTQVAAPAVGNSLRGNSIFANAGLGINLVGHDSAFGVTLNDTGDTDTGGNNLQNFPVLDATNNPALLTGRFFSAPNHSYTVDFYGNHAASPSGYGQGEIYLGSKPVTTGADGKATFMFTNRQPAFPDEVFAATATSQATRDTSEFSAVPLTVIGLTPSQGPVGTRVIIRGTSLSDVATLRFQNVAAPFTLQSPSQISTVVPQGAPVGNDPLVVTTRSTHATVALNRVFTVTPAPSNDDFESAQAISGLNGSVVGANLQATDQYSAGEPHHALTGGGHSVWYRWVAPGSGPAVFTTTGSDFKAVLAAYTGSSLGHLTLVARSLNLGPTAVASRIAFNAVQGTTYDIAVDSDADREGNVQLNWTLAATLPANATVAAATPITGVAGSTAAPANLPHQPIWFKWPVRRHGNTDTYDDIAPQGGTVTFDTAGSTFDSRLSVYAGTSPVTSSLSLLTGPLAQNDDARPDGTSQVTLTVRPRTTYYVAVDGVNESVGSVVLSWTAGAARGGTMHWAGPVSGVWSDPTRWSTGRVPDTTDTVAIDAPGEYQVDLDVDATVTGLTLGSPDGGGGQHLAVASHSLVLLAQNTIGTSGVLDLNGGSIFQNNTLTALGTLNWNGGTLAGKGTTYINPGGVLNIGDPAGATTQKLLSQQTISNYGRVNWTGATAIIGDSGASVLNSGTFEVTQGGAFTAASTATTLLPSFYNYGTFIRDANTGTTTFGVPFNNRGTVSVRTGTLALLGGGLNYGRFDVAAGAVMDFASDCFFDKQQTTFTGAGQVLVSSNTLTVDAPVVMQNLALGGGALTGPSDISVGAGASGNSVLDWRSGAMTGNGSTSVAGRAALVIEGTADKTLSGRTLNNQGTANWSGSGKIVAGDGAVINNAGTFNAHAGATIAHSGTGGKLLFANAGTLNPGDGPAPSPVPGLGDTRLLGTSSPGPGTMNVDGAFAQSITGALNIDIGGALEAQFDQVKVSSSATLAGTLNVSLLHNFQPRLGATFEVLHYATHTGNFHTVNLPSLSPGLTWRTDIRANGVFLVVVRAAHLVLFPFGA